MIVTEREREAETQAERSRLHAPGARHGNRSWVSRITPWAKGRRQTGATPRDPSIHLSMDTEAPSSLAIVDIAARNIGVQVSWRFIASVSLG